MERVRKILREALLLEYLGVNEDVMEIAEQITKICHQCSDNKCSYMEDWQTQLGLLKVFIEYTEDYSDTRGYFSPQDNVIHIYVGPQFDDEEVQDTIVHELTHFRQSSSGKHQQSMQHVVQHLLSQDDSYDDYMPEVIKFLSYKFGFFFVLQNQFIIGAYEKFCRYMSGILYVTQVEEQDAFVSGTYGKYRNCKTLPTFKDFVYNGQIGNSIHGIDNAISNLQDPQQRQLTDILMLVFSNTAFTNGPRDVPEMVNFLSYRKKRILTKAGRTYQRLKDEFEARNQQETGI